MGILANLKARRPEFHKLSFGYGKMGVWQDGTVGYFEPVKTQPLFQAPLSMVTGAIGVKDSATKEMVSILAEGNTLATFKAPMGTAVKIHAWLTEYKANM